MDMGKGFNLNRKGTGSINIEQLKKGLLQLQPSRLPTKIAVLRELLDVVDQMHDAGVPYADIAAYLTQHTQIEFKDGALKSMLSKLRKEAKAQREDDASGTSHGSPSSDTSHNG